jgi:hypothetical protein
MRSSILTLGVNSHLEIQNIRKMKRRTALLIVFCVFFCTATVFALFVLSHNLNSVYNSFVRNFPPGTITNEKIFDIKYNSYYISGATNSDIYLGNLTAPLHLLTINKNLTDTQYVKLTVENLEKDYLKSSTLRIDSPNFYIIDGTLPGIFKGELGSWKARKFMYDSVFFTESIPMGAKSIAIRALDARSREYELGKLQADTPHVKLMTNLLEKQVDGIFCTDGILHYNKKAKSFAYVYYYRNQFILMDTSLNLLYRGKTIDTISHAQIKVAKIKSENSMNMAAPPLVVNKQSAVSGNWLFINSNVKAKHEDK